MTGACSLRVSQDSASECGSSRGKGVAGTEEIQDSTDLPRAYSSGTSAGIVTGLLSQHMAMATGMLTRKTAARMAAAGICMGSSCMDTSRPTATPPASVCWVGFQTRLSRKCLANQRRLALAFSRRGCLSRR